jgi:hypothetical protein
MCLFNEAYLLCDRQVSQYINWNVFSNTFTRVLYFMFTDAIRTQTRPNQKLRVVGERNSGRRHIGQTPSTTDSKRGAARIYCSTFHIKEGLGLS